jgi:hypothetical protein
MAIPDTPTETWREAVRNAWSAAELADSEAKLELWDSSRAQSAASRAWSAVAVAAAGAP